MQGLSEEKIYEILLPLPVSDIARFCQSNQRFSEVCRDQYFWRLKYQHDYGQTNFADLIREFPDVYSDNWRLANQYRHLVQEYANIHFAKRETLEDIKRDLDTGRNTPISISVSALRLLGLWNPQKLRPQFEQAYGPFDPSKTQKEIEEELEDILESDGVRVGDKNSNLILDEMLPTTDLVGFPSLMDEDIWFNDRDVPLNIISADDIVTPRIITIAIQIYDEMYLQTAPTKGLPVDEYPGFTYVYTSTGPGFTLKELYLLAKESIRKYLYIARMIKTRAYYDLHNIRCNEIQYRDGKYYPQAFALRAL